MGIRISQTKNANLLSGRISSGDLDQYFNSPSDEDILELSDALNRDDFNDIADVLQGLVNSSGSDISEAINVSYDAEMEELAERFVGQYISEKIIETKIAIEKGNASDLDNVEREIEKIAFSTGFKTDIINLKSQIKKSKKLISIPKKLQKDVKKIIKKKERDINLVTSAKVRMGMGFIKKPVIVIRGRTTLESKRNVILGIKILTEEEYKEKRTFKKDIPKVEFKPIRKEIKQTTIKEYRKDMRGKPLDFKEKAFVDASIEEGIDFEQIYFEYKEVFGDVRNKTELRGLIKERR